MIHIIKSTPTSQQIEEMPEHYSYAKLAVDVRQGVVAGGGEMHADCEAVLLENGSRQQDVWGADWRPKQNRATFESLINIRPAQGNSKMTIEDTVLREKIEVIVRKVFGNASSFKSARKISPRYYASPFGGG